MLRRRSDSGPDEGVGDPLCASSPDGVEMYRSSWRERENVLWVGLSPGSGEAVLKIRDAPFGRTSKYCAKNDGGALA